MRSYTQLAKKFRFELCHNLNFLSNWLRILSLLFLCSQVIASEELLFTPPTGWISADSKLLSERIKLMVVGPTSGYYPPSINLGVEPYPGTLKDYLKMVKAVNAAQDATWKDLGSVKTTVGPASLSQVDMKTEWGPVRLLHVIFIRDGNVYVLTAGALKEEFPFYYEDFFQAMTSIRFSAS